MHNFDITNFTNFSLLFENCEVIELPIEAVKSFDFLDLFLSKEKNNSFSVSSFDLKISIPILEASNSNMGKWKQSFTKRIFTNRDLVKIKFFSDCHEVSIDSPWYNGSDGDLNTDYYDFYSYNKFQINSIPSEDVLLISIDKSNLSKETSSNFNFNSVLILNDFEKKFLDDQILDLKNILSIHSNAPSSTNPSSKEHSSYPPKSEKNTEDFFNKLKIITENLEQVSLGTSFEHFHSIKAKKN